MPTYDYQCEKCGTIFEEFQSISAPPLTTCRTAGCDGAVKRLFSPGAGFIFKGSGFYITDYRSEAYKKQAKADAAASGSSSTPSVPSAPAKPSAGSSNT
jgi:putative FmdB family regulatory protein